MATLCPECENPLDVDVDEVEEGDTVTCDECGQEMEIVSTEPLQMTPIDAEGYDDEEDSYPSRTGDDEEEE